MDVRVTADARGAMQRHTALFCIHITGIGESPAAELHSAMPVIGAFLHPGSGLPVSYQYVLFSNNPVTGYSSCIELNAESTTISWVLPILILAKAPCHTV